MKNAVVSFWQKVVMDEKGDLVQNIMWLAFIALACVAAIGTLGEKLGKAAGNATDKLDESLAKE